jgi:hypothetical protein
MLYNPAWCYLRPSIQRSQSQCSLAVLLPRLGVQHGKLTMDIVQLSSVLRVVGMLFNQQAGPSCQASFSVLLSFEVQTSQYKTSVLVQSVNVLWEVVTAH